MTIVAVRLSFLSPGLATRRLEGETGAEIIPNKVVSPADTSEGRGRRKRAWSQRACFPSVSCWSLDLRLLGRRIFLVNRKRIQLSERFPLKSTWSLRYLDGGPLSATKRLPRPGSNRQINYSWIHRRGSFSSGRFERIKRNVYEYAKNGE